MSEARLQSCDHHVLTFASTHREAALAAVEDLLARTGAVLDGLKVKPVGRIVETTLQLRDLSVASADAAGDRLAARPGVSALRLEHVWSLL